MNLLASIFVLVALTQVGVMGMHRSANRKYLFYIKMNFPMKHL